MVIVRPVVVASKRSVPEPEKFQVAVVSIVSDFARDITAVGAVKVAAVTANEPLRSSVVALAALKVPPVMLVSPVTVKALETVIVPE